ncbi:hypothetical protein FSP39_022815, partial [Pinctada imbricata]
FYSRLQERFKLLSSNNIFRDVIDGSLYRTLVQNNGPLSNPDNISFTFNTDGAPVFKSSKTSIWPIYLMINELPYRMRIRKENMLLVGLWFGKLKPAMNTFLKPFLKSMEILNKGIELYSPERGTFTLRGWLLCGTADLPARSLLCNSVQYNGSYSCWKCTQRGETAQVGRGHTHVFPYIAENPKGPIRTGLSVINDAKEAIRNQQNKINPKTINGIKGPTWLECFPKFNIASGIAIDYMHGLLLGVQKLLLRLWFSTDFSGERFNHYGEISKVDKRLISIKPTLDISRLPRTIENELKYWKAKEFRSFLLYYGVPVLNGIIPRQYLYHYLNLVNASHILLKYGSTKEEVDNAEKMLFRFCRDFSYFYDAKFMTLNVHQLLHMADSVRELGPLYSHSCFPFEDKNGFVLKLIRGTQNIDDQIIGGISFVQKIPELRAYCIEKGSPEDDLYTELERSDTVKRGEKIGNDIFILGAVKLKELSGDEYYLIARHSCTHTDTFVCFNRLDFKGMLIYGLDYLRMSKRDNSVISWSFNNQTRFGQVKHFICADDKYFAFVYELVCKNYDTTSSILAVETSSDLQLVPVSDFIEQCMIVTISDTNQSYVCKFPNRIESD